MQKQTKTYSQSYHKLQKIKDKETDESTVMVGDFNIPLSEMGRCSRQKISKDTVDLHQEAKRAQ